MKRMLNRLKLALLKHSPIPHKWYHLDFDGKMFGHLCDKGKSEYFSLVYSKREQSVKKEMGSNCPKPL